MKRLVLAATLVLCLAACGSGGGSSTTLALDNPSTPGGLTVDITGSSKAAPAVAHELEQLTNGGLVAAQTGDAASKPPRKCSRTIALVTYPVTEPSLKGLDGQKVTLAVYGNSQTATATCSQLPAEFPHGIPVVGGNRRIYQQPSSAMEPTLHCAKPATGCSGSAADLLLTPLTGAKGLQRQDIAVFYTPPAAANVCGEGGVFVKRVIGLPGESVREDGHGFLWTRASGSSAWTKLSEPYVSAASRAADVSHFDQHWNVPPGEYFLVGDNRSESCDSRQWGSVPATSVIGPVTQIVRDGKALTPAGIPG
ncbi:MAG TPA: signal peptidase I [Gaiellaceae bacterium]|jgi:signal peptidase I